MFTIALTLYVIACALCVLGLCHSAARLMPRPNRRGGRLGRLLDLNGGLK